MPRRMKLRMRRLVPTVLAVALASAALVFVTDPPRVAVAAPGDECPAVPIWVNTWNGTGVLAQYSPTGTALSSVPVAAAYGDIGLSTDGTRLFGTSFTDSLMYPILYELDPATGSVIDSIPLDSGHITTMTQTERVWLNSLTAISETVFLTGGPNSSAIIAYDFATDSTSLYATLPGGRTLAGDFSVLRDGDILVSARNAAGTVYDMLRLHPDGTFTVVGRLAGAVFGMAQSGGVMYFTASTGELWTLPISSIPTTESNAVLATGTVAATGLPFYGATSVQDGSVCNAMSLTKDAAPTTVSAVGETVTYTFTITNVSDVTISSLTLSDVQQAPAGALTSGPSCAATILVSQVSTTCTASYTVTQADLDHGSIRDTAVASGLSPLGQDLESNRASATVAVAVQPELTLVKSVSPATVSAPGTVVDYTFEVTNTGNQTVQDVAIDETAFTGSGAMSAPVCPVTFLQPGDAVECTASYTVTQADIDNGSVENEAVATGETLAGTAVTSAPSTATVTAAQNPSLRLVKSATPSTVADYVVNQVITYSFVVTNDGNVTIEDIAITEVAFDGVNGPLAVTCPAGAASLAPGAQVVCTATYTLDQPDIDRLSTSNTARAEGETPAGASVASNDSTVVIPGPYTPELTLDKEVAATATQAGDVLKYTFTVTNTGNITLTDIAIEELAFSGTAFPAVSCPSTGPLLPGQFLVCTASYTVTQTDVDSGSVTNTARATAEDALGTPVVSPDDTATAPLPQNPALDIVKTADATGATGAGVDSIPSEAIVTIDADAALSLVKTATWDANAGVGDLVVYYFQVTNTGGLTLRDVRVDETAFSGAGRISPLTCGIGNVSLAPGQSVTCYATYTITGPDVDARRVTNTAVATGSPLRGPDPTSNFSSVEVVLAASTSGGGSLTNSGAALNPLIPASALVAMLGGLWLILRRRPARD